MQRLFDIVVDSCVDMPEEYLKKAGVDVTPLGFNIGDVAYGGEQGLKMSTADFYAALSGGAMPTTSQVTSGQATEHIEQHLKRGRDVLVIAFSSALSGTAGSFFVAARELLEKYPERKVEVVDSLCASMGEGLLLDYVLKKAAGGATLAQTKAYAEKLKGQICHVFTVDNLFHLKRGGRVSTGAALVGSILNIKPILHVDEQGKLVSVGKAMGRKKSLQALVERMIKTQALQAGEQIFVSHADAETDAKKLAQTLQETFPSNPVLLGEIGPVIGAHAGAGTVALFYRGRNR